MRLASSEAIKLMIKRTGNSITSVGRTLGYGGPASIANMLTRDSMKLSMAAKIAEVCGYKLLFVPKRMEIDDSIEIVGEL